MARVFCFVNFELNTMKCNAVINCENKTVSVFFVSLINMINILREITERLFK